MGKNSIGGQTVFSTTIALLQRQKDLINYYVINKYTKSRSGFIQEAIDFYTLYFEGILEISGPRKKKDFKKKEPIVLDYLTRNNIKVIRRLE